MLTTPISPITKLIIFRAVEVPKDTYLQEDDIKARQPGVWRAMHEYLRQNRNAVLGELETVQTTDDQWAYPYMSLRGPITALPQEFIMLELKGSQVPVGIDPYWTIEDIEVPEDPREKELQANAFPGPGPSL